MCFWQSVDDNVELLGGFFGSKKEASTANATSYRDWVLRAGGFSLTDLSLSIAAATSQPPLRPTS